MKKLVHYIHMTKIRDIIDIRNSGGVKTRVPKGSRTLLTCFANMSLYRYRDVVEPDSIEESPSAFQADVPQPPIRKLHCTPVSTRNLFTSFGGSFTP